MAARTAKPKPASIANPTLPATADWPAAPTIIAAALIDVATETVGDDASSGALA